MAVFPNRNEYESKASCPGTALYLEIKAIPASVTEENEGFPEYLLKQEGCVPDKEEPKNDLKSWCSQIIVLKYMFITSLVCVYFIFKSPKCSLSHIKEEGL